MGEVVSAMRVRASLVEIREIGDGADPGCRRGRWKTEGPSAPLCLALRDDVLAELLMDELYARR
jgi:hypothetical protein